MAKATGTRNGSRLSPLMKKALLVGGVVLMARSKNRVLRSLGRVGGAMVAPRIVSVLRR